MTELSENYRQQSYTAVPQTEVNDPLSAKIEDIEAQTTKPSATPDKITNPFKFIPKSMIVGLASIPCIIFLCAVLVMPILQLVIGLTYRDQCPINPKIPHYLIVAGACGVITVLLALVMAGVLICVMKTESGSGALAATCFVSITLLTVFLMAIFLSVWFIFGAVWVFGAKKYVVHDDPKSLKYCDSTLYYFAFTILILSIVAPIIRCIIGCFRGGNEASQSR